LQLPGLGLDSIDYFSSGHPVFLDSFIADCILTMERTAEWERDDEKEEVSNAAVPSVNVMSSPEMPVTSASLNTKGESDITKPDGTEPIVSPDDSLKATQDNPADGLEGDQLNPDPPVLVSNSKTPDVVEPPEEEVFNAAVPSVDTISSPEMPVTSASLNTRGGSNVAKPNGAQHIFSPDDLRLPKIIQPTALKVTKLIRTHHCLSQTVRHPMLLNHQKKMKKVEKPLMISACVVGARMPTLTIKGALQQFLRLPP
jgi:hypothetical protein